MLGFLKEALSPITDIVKGPLNEWQKRKTIAVKSKMEVAKIHASAEVAKANIHLEMAKQGQQIEGDWDKTAQEQMKFSWKDEVLMLIVVAPFVGSFIPGIQDYVKDGWGYVATAPTWWTFSFLGIIAAVFGLRWLVAPLVKKMGLK